MTIDIDPALEKRLCEEKLIWLTTVRDDGTPQPVPVWFLWQDGRFVIYSQPGAKKIRNIENNPRVAVHFNSDPWGDHVVVMTGRATVDFDAAPLSACPAYIEKYREGLLKLEWEAESMAEEYSAGIYLTPTWLRNEVT